ncbi:MAG: hypothetical protein WCB15_21650, partial [Desulfobacterales bacterium]
MLTVYNLAKNVPFAVSDLNSLFPGAGMQSCRPQLLDKYQIVWISGGIEFICDWRIYLQDVYG